MEDQSLPLLQVNSMSSCNNKRNFKRRRNGRSHSVFHIWNRDKRREESEAFKLKLNKRSILSRPCHAKYNDNYQKYGFHSSQRHFPFEDEPLSSFTKLSKATTSTCGSSSAACPNGDKISKILPPSPPPLLLPASSEPFLFSSPISSNWWQSGQTDLQNGERRDQDHHLQPRLAAEERVKVGTTELELMPKSIPLPPPSLLASNVPHGPRTNSGVWHRQHQLQSPSSSVRRPSSPRLSKVPSVVAAQLILIRLLSLILRVTCISHYCSKLFFSFPPFSTFRRSSSSSSSHHLLHSPTFDLKSPEKRSSSPRPTRLWTSFLLRPSWLWSNVASSSPTPPAPQQPLPLSSSCTGGRRRCGFCVSGSRRRSGGGCCDGMRKRKPSSTTLTTSESHPTFSNGPLSKRVRCQISSVRSDFIYIIVFALCVLLPNVAPVITSNEIHVYPMDSASSADRAEAGKLKLIDQLFHVVRLLFLNFTNTMQKPIQGQ